MLVSALFSLEPPASDAWPNPLSHPFMPHPAHIRHLSPSSCVITPPSSFDPSLFIHPQLPPTLHSTRFLDLTPKTAYTITLCAYNPVGESVKLSVDGVASPYLLPQHPTIAPSPSLVPSPYHSIFPPSTSSPYNIIMCHRPASPILHLVICHIPLPPPHLPKLTHPPARNLASPTSPDPI